MVTTIFLSCTSNEFQGIISTEFTTSFIDIIYKVIKKVCHCDDANILKYGADDANILKYGACDQTYTS